MITSKRIFKQLIEALEFCDLYLINVTCPLQELIRREQQRKNRCLGSAINVLQNGPNAIYKVMNKIKLED